jgi:hypothetical protein
MNATCSSTVPKTIYCLDQNLKYDNTEAILSCFTMLTAEQIKRCRPNILIWRKFRCCDGRCGIQASKIVIAQEIMVDTLPHVLFTKGGLKTFEQPSIKMWEYKFEHDAVSWISHPEKLEWYAINDFEQLVLHTSNYPKPSG